MRSMSCAAVIALAAGLAVACVTSEEPMADAVVDVGPDAGDACTAHGDCPDGAYCARALGACEGEGACEVRPAGCPEYWAPVCGCDGTTYGNPCEAAAAGVNVASSGACAPPLCGGIGGFSCPDGQFCEFAVATCHIVDNAGECVDVPLGCPDHVAPVCGCDGVTYGNDCERQSARVSKDHDGACAATACADNAACGAGWYCAKALCEGQGACAPRPEACDTEYLPVCGCDDETYSNACAAAAAGVSVAHEGACGPGFCGGIAGFPCPGGEFCEFEAGTCHVADNAGACVAIPQECPAHVAPVCGCDGVTYGNDCARQAARISKDHDGACAATACADNAACGAGLYCAKAQCDGLGACAARPEACDTEYLPVCGCDEQTYSNACVAAAAGVNVASQGACAPGLCGGIAGFSCPDGQFCELEVATCHIVDNAGACVAIPQQCPAHVAPVCGCDAMTYTNDCERQAARISKDHDGRCDEVCGGFAGYACPAGRRCDLPPGTCHWADHFGTCVDDPLGCPDVWDPVCGCDGQVYGNDCERLMAGAQLDHLGACEP